MCFSATASARSASGAVGSLIRVTGVLMTHVYSFFSHVLWPAYVPVAVLIAAPARAPHCRRRQGAWVRDDLTEELR